MTITSNVHVHTSWCDGFNTPEEMTKAAVKIGFSDLGFSSHSYAPFDPPCSGVASYEGYKKDILELKENYQGTLNILLGIERDMLSEVPNDFFDYTILSAHYFPLLNGRYDSVDHNPEKLEEVLKERFSGSNIALADEYFSFLAKGVKEFRPDILGHYDVITKFNKDNRFFDEESKPYQDVALCYLDSIIDCLNEYGGMIELNTSGMRYKGTGYPYAGSPFLLKRILEKKARVIITGDSHETKYLNYKFNEALELIKEYKFSSMVMLKNGIFCDVKI